MSTPSSAHQVLSSIRAKGVQGIKSLLLPIDAAKGNDLVTVDWKVTYDDDDQIAQIEFVVSPKDPTNIVWAVVPGFYVPGTPNLYAATLIGAELKSFKEGAALGGTFLTRISERGITVSAGLGGFVSANGEELNDFSFSQELVIR